MKTTTLCFAPSLTRNEAGHPTRFSGIAYSGGVIPGYGDYGQAAIDLSTFTPPTGPIFALLDHDPTQRVGKLTAELRDHQLHIAGEFFTTSEAGRHVAALFAEGAPWQLSVGVQANVETGPRARRLQCNGQTLTVDTLFTGATLREVSFVPVGADPATQAHAFSATALTGDPVETKALTEKIAELETGLAAEKARADQAESRLADLHASARKEALIQLAAKIGRPLTAEETTVFTALPDPAYQTVAAALAYAPAKPVAGEHLFRAQALDGKTPGTAPTIEEMNALLLQQVAQG